MTDPAISGGSPPTADGGGPAPPAVELIDVAKSYGPLSVLRGIGLAVARAERVVLIGASGSGKSTLLRVVAGLERIERGEVRVDGSPIQVGHAKHDSRVKLARSVEARAEVGMVFQHFNLFPNMSVIENVCLALRLVRRMTRDETRSIGEQMLERVGLLSHRDAAPNRLSGGQKQRVAIARALAMRPRIMLFDEATSALDPELVGEVLDVMRELAGEGMTMMIVTHEMKFARDVANRIVFMDGGTILEQGPPEAVLGAPTHERTRTFLQRVLDH